MRNDALLLPIAMGYVYLAVPVGSFIMLINAAANLYDHVLTLARPWARP